MNTTEVLGQSGLGNTFPPKITGTKRFSAISDSRVDDGAMRSAAKHLTISIICRKTCEKKANLYISILILFYLFGLIC